MEKWTIHQIYLLLFVATITAACSSNGIDVPQAQEGILDLSNWDFEADGHVKLDGQWEFYWSQFISSQEFKNQDFIPMTAFFESPGIWRRMTFEGKDLDWRGYATMRLKILLADDGKNLAIEARDIRSAYEMDINGELVAKCGSIGKTADTSLPEFKVNRLLLNQASNQLEIVVRLSEFHRDSGGFPVSLVLGTNDQILRKARNAAIEEWLLIGFLLFSAIYHLGLYFLRSTKIINLYFGIFCVNFILRLLTRGEKVLFDITPASWWFAVNKLEFITLYLIPLIYLAYYDKLFEKRINLKLYWGAQIVFGILALYVLVVPAHMIYYSLDLFLYVGVISVMVLLYLGYRAYLDKVAHSEIFLLGFLILLAGVINDFLYFNYIFRVVEVFNYSCIIFIFTQAYEMATRSALAFSYEEELTRSLDQKVSERTEQLSKANMVKGKLLSIVSHDLRGPLTSLKGLLELAEREQLEKKEEKRLFKGLRQSIDSSLLLLDNILFWASSQLKSNVVQVHKEDLSLRSMVLQSRKPYLQQAKQKNIEIICDIDTAVRVFSDKNMLKSVLRNLISNAIKYTLENGIVRIFSERKGNELVISVVDSGIGLSEEILEILFDVNRVKSRLGTSQEKGIGVGLLLCEDLIKQLGGKIWVESIEEGKGTRFSFSLPMGTE